MIDSSGRPVGGVWVAYHGDGSSFAVFAEEVEAYRHALPMAMRVTFLPYGVEIRDHEDAQRKPGAARPAPSTSSPAGGADATPPQASTPSPSAAHPRARAQAR